MTETTTSDQFTVGQELYAATKNGNIKAWSCSVAAEKKDQTGPATLIIVSKTKLDGKPITRHENISTGKNVGRANETTPYQQACSEAASRYRKKLDKGYSLKVPTDTTQAGTNSLGYPMPMLAKPIDKVKTVEFPAILQPKLDGHRAIVTKQKGHMIMYSRQGKVITTMNHILSFMTDHMSNGEFYDGELYIHGTPLQDIGKLVKKWRLDSVKVSFCVYDYITDEPYTERIHSLEALWSGMIGKTKPPIYMITGDVVQDMEEAIKKTDWYIAQGFEGGILRTPDTGYEAGFRSSSLLKIKKFDDHEFKILQVIEGKARNVNDTALKVAVFQCALNDNTGRTFEVLAHGTQEEKDYAFHHQDEFVNKMLTVRHSGWTKDKMPWHPTAVRLKEDV